MIHYYYYYYIIMCPTFRWRGGSVVSSSPETSQGGKSVKSGPCQEQKKHLYYETGVGLRESPKSGKVNPIHRPIFRPAHLGSSPFLCLQQTCIMAATSTCSMSVVPELKLTCLKENTTAGSRRREYIFCTRYIHDIRFDAPNEVVVKA